MKRSMKGVSAAAMASPSFRDVALGMPHPSMTTGRNEHDDRVAGKASRRYHVLKTTLCVSEAISARTDGERRRAGF